jgi:hypothetical protein
VVDYQQMFTTQPPNDADVIISNTYPNDCSLIFARMKGFVPLNHSRPAETRIAIAACSEGLGLHNIWPFVNIPPRHRLKHTLRVLSVLNLKEILEKGFYVAQRILSSLHIQNSAGYVQEVGRHILINPIQLYLASGSDINLPSNVPGIRITSDWQEIIKTVTQEQSKQDHVKVLVYPCAFLKILKE